MIRINREEFLNDLECVQAGIASREIVEQSSCFVFRKGKKKGKLMTYNDEIACRLTTKYNGLEGAVQALPLLAILKKLKEPEIMLEMDSEYLKIHGKRKKVTAIRMESKILLPIDVVDNPGEWKPLHEDFHEALLMVQECSGKDETNFWVSCLHLHPKFIEACDNFQMCRFKLKTGFDAPALVRAVAVRALTTLDMGMTEFSETDNWVHFRNGNGLVFSCRRWVEEFPSIGNHFTVDEDAATVALPKGLEDTLGRAEIFSSENVDNNQVQVTLKPGRLEIKGRGVSGYHIEPKRIQYNGPELAFLLSPKLLLELVKRHNECQLTENLLKVHAGKFVYVACLSKEQDSAAKEETNEEDTTDTEE